MQRDKERLCGIFFFCLRKQNDKVESNLALNHQSSDLPNESLTNHNHQIIALHTVQNQARQMCGVRRQPPRASPSLYFETVARNS